MVTALALFLLVPGAFADSFAIPDPNIIGFANATSCGGATLCNNGQAYNLSQIGSWLSTPTSSQSYLVKNDTGHIITSLTFMVIGSFQTTNGPWENFQCQVGAPKYFGGCSLSGVGFLAYTQLPNGTSAAANFIALPVTFSWTGGKGIPIGATFDLQTASWVNNVGSQVPEPSASLLLGSGLLSLLGLRRLWAKQKAEA